MVKIRPFLKWAGGKYNCLEKIIPSFPPGTRLIEPFTGSGVIFMNTEYASHLMAESNMDLIQLFTFLKLDGSSFIDYCQQYFKPETNIKEYYYEARSRFNSLKSCRERSALFLYLNRHGYNGLCRYNLSGIYNVPFGLYKQPYFPLNEMLLFHQKIEKAEFIHNDFRQTFAQAKPGDVIYCDPPYVPLQKHTKTIAYTKNVFNEDDQIELAELAKLTAAKGIPVLISNHDTKFTRAHYQGAKIKSFNVSRLINSNTGARQPAKEILALFRP